MTTLNIGIASYGQMKARTLALARGERQVGKEEPKVWFTSIESLAKILSERNRELLLLIAREGPDSLTRLAELTGREKSNLSRTLKTMSGYGLIELERGERGTIIPQVPYDQLTHEEGENESAPARPPRTASSVGCDCKTPNGVERVQSFPAHRDRRKRWPHKGSEPSRRLSETTGPPFHPRSVLSFASEGNRLHDRTEQRGVVHHT